MYKIKRKIKRRRAEVEYNVNVTNPEVGDNRLYAFDVFITGGPITEKFAQTNPVVSRTVQIRGDQTLGQLHEAIFDAFDRFEEHLYEFQFGKGHHDPNDDRFTLPEALEDFFPRRKPARDATRTAIGSLGLEAGQSFYYWFDFGDDWWHQINVVSIDDEAPKGKYPKVTMRVGESPPQYVDWDEEEV